MELLGDLAETETLEVGALDDRSLQVGQAIELPPQPIAPLLALGAALRLGPRDGTPSIGSGGIEFSPIGPRRLPTEPIDQMPSRNQHHPGHELGAMGIKPIRRPPKSHKDLLGRILGFSARSQHLAGGLENKGTKSTIKLVERGLFGGRNPLHELPIGSFLRVHQESCPCC